MNFVRICKQSSTEFSAVKHLLKYIQLFWLLALLEQLPQVMWLCLDLNEGCIVRAGQSSREGVPTPGSAPIFDTSRKFLRILRYSLWNRLPKSCFCGGMAIKWNEPSNFIAEFSFDWVPRKAKADCYVTLVLHSWLCTVEFFVRHWVRHISWSNLTWKCWSPNLKSAVLWMICFASRSGYISGYILDPSVMSMSLLVEDILAR